MITLKDLSFSYGRHKVLGNVSMTLEKGKIYGLLGENGVGKSTLLKILSGLLKPEGGRVYRFWGGSVQQESFLPAGCVLSSGGFYG